MDILHVPRKIQWVSKKSLTLNQSPMNEYPEKPDVKDDLLDSAAPSTSAKSPHSPQRSDFGLEQYIVSQVLPNPPQAVNNEKEEPKILTPFSKQSLVKTPKCALKMDDFELVSLNTQCV